MVKVYLATRYSGKACAAEGRRAKMDPGNGARIMPLWTSGSPMEEVPAMVAVLRCDHCDAVLSEEYLERERKRFCCSACARAFDRGELKAISPHRHDSVAVSAEPAGLR